jgi:hypothetical protein
MRIARALRFCRARLWPLAGALVACSGPPPVASGPQACATNADCRGGRVCQMASGPGFCGNCAHGANLAVAAGPYCLETGWGTNLGTGGQGDSCPTGDVGCVVGSACTQLLRCDIGDVTGLYECPPAYDCNFEQCVPSANPGLPCPPGSGYLPSSSACGALVYLASRTQEGTCILYAPPCDEDAGAPSCPSVLSQDQPVNGGYVSGPIEQVCLPDILFGNGHVCTPLRTCAGSADCTDAPFSTCYDVDPRTGAPAGTCVAPSLSDAGLDATLGPLALTRTPALE